ncbi:TonB-dependent receptor [Litoribacter ruber]|uniref:TonB-dependent receptor n=1 Tax=Litoribacter ruber TaxID=702568 RepID=UPI001FEB56B0|nr:TonB-dependent receptor [Litoribacter ruber]
MYFQTLTKVVLAACFLLLANVSQVRAQDALVDFSADTVALEGVDVFAPDYLKYSLGHTVKKLAKNHLQEFHGQDLGAMLQKRTGIFVRQYGPGMLASVTMRGASAGHTAVFWNGLPINSPSLGQTDFSIVPVNGIDQATIHFGGSAALYGTDAIGGSIHLDSELQFNQGHQVEIQQGAGSFGRFNSQVKYGYSTEKLALRTSIYRNSAKNDFPFRNRSRIGQPMERQVNAAVEQYGVNQDLGWNLGANSQIKTSLWWNLTDRELQPLMGSNAREVQKDQNLRWALDYLLYGEKSLFNVKVGVIHDEMIFDRTSRNLVTQYLVSTDYEKKVSDSWESKSGLRYTLIDGNLSSYHAMDNRLEAYHSSSFRITERLSSSVNMRQLIYEGNWAPFTPSVSGTYSFVQSETHHLAANTAISRNFKVPTLNDRFWQPGGNPDLLPEDSWSSEVGLMHNWEGTSTQVETRVNYYRMKVENWIIWLPTGNFWTPSNIRNVNNRGVEAFFEANQKVGQGTVGLDLNYAYTRAQISSDDNESTIGRQLPYTPLHKRNIQLSYKWKGLRFFAAQTYVDENFVTTDNSLDIPSYTLYDLGASWEGRLLGQALRFQGQVHNVLNTEYQVLRQRPMPGRNYNINIHFKF